MEFSKYLLNDATISFTKGVSVLRSIDESLFLKHNNKLYRLSSRSELVSLSRLFRILRLPRKLEEILTLMPEFKRGGVIDVLHALHQRNFITIQREMDKDVFKRNDLDPTYLTEPLEQGKLPMVGSQIILIGDGFLANRLAMMFKKMNVKINRIKSITKLFKPSKITVDEILGENNKGVSEIASALSLSFTLSLNKSDLVIVVEDFQNIAFFELINKICFEKKKAWIRMSFDDNIGYLGPMVLPGRTSCFNCCELRLVTNSPDYEYELWRNRQLIPKTRLQVPKIFADFFSAICAKEVSRYMTHSKELETIDTLIIFDTRQPRFTKHKLFRHPNCIYCNSIGLGKKLRSKSSHDPFSATRQTIMINRNFETSACLSENELLQRLRKLIDSRTGIIVETKKLFMENSLGIDSHYSFYANCYKPLRIGLKGELTKLVDFDARLIDPSPSGSGLSPTEAEVHTLMEAVERYSTMFVDESRFNRSTYRDIEKKAINPLDLGLYLDERYVQSKKISRFSIDTELPWIRGQDLNSGKPVFIAADFVHYPSIREKPIVFANSSGSSAHTDLVPAILNGLYEVIERDSLLTMWLNKIPMPMLEIKTLPSNLNEMINLISEYGMKVKLVDLTSDSLVPTVMAVCYNNNPDKYPALVTGAATHIETEKAVQKALFEMEKMLMLHLEKIPKMILDPNKISSIYENGIYYLNPKKRKYWEFMISSNQTSKPSRFAGKAFNDQNVVLKQIVTHLHTKGHRVVYVDITPSDIRSLGLVAVKVFVTGFQPLYSGNKMRLIRNRLLQSAEYIRDNIGATRVGTEINSAPHPLA